MGILASDIPISELIPLGGSAVLMTLLLRMWAAERVRWIRERAQLVDDHTAERKALVEEHVAEIARHDELCDKRVAFWREAAERFEKAAEK